MAGGVGGGVGVVAFLLRLLYGTALGVGESEVGGSRGGECAGSVFPCDMDAACLAQEVWGLCTQDVQAIGIARE